MMAHRRPQQQTAFYKGFSHPPGISGTRKARNLQRPRRRRIDFGRGETLAGVGRGRWPRSSYRGCPFAGRGDRIAQRRPAEVGLGSGFNPRGVASSSPVRSVWMRRASTNPELPEPSDWLSAFRPFSPYVCYAPTGASNSTVTIWGFWDWRGLMNGGLTWN